MGRVKTIFLDSDGVLNEAVIQNGKPVAPTSVKSLIIPAEVKPCLERFKNAGYLMVMITNKPDVVEGRMTQQDVDAIFAKMQATLPEITDIFACYHRDADCFKPKPGMLLEAAKKYDIDLENSYMIGDRGSDIAAGQAAGTHTVWINRGYEVNQTPNPPADFTASSLTEAADWILGEHNE